jgi:predicted ATPase
MKFLIKSIQFIEGFPLTLPAIGPKKVEFTNGINILVGKNGCGKSTILKTLKAYCGFCLPHRFISSS